MKILTLLPLMLFSATSVETSGASYPDTSSPHPLMSGAAILGGMGILHLIRPRHFGC